VVAALQRERDVLAADGRINADIDLPQLSRQTVGEHLRFDDTNPGRGELPLDEGDQRLEIVGALWHGLLCAILPRRVAQI